LDIYALRIGGGSEVWDFVEKLSQTDPKRWATLIAVFSMVGEMGFRTPENYYCRLRGWPDQWEIRSGRDRLHGFEVGSSVILCCRRLKQGQKTDREVLERVDRLRREWLDEYEAPR
jgi:hypothetical protein